MKPIKQEQLDYQNWELGVFFHFGIRTFYEGFRDWDERPMPLEGFNPTDFDCRQWLRIARDGGAKYAVLVCKHHDGFANWPSKYTDYSIANTPWRDGKGDVVKEFTDACREYGLKVGLYYSPAQIGFEDWDGKKYDDYFVNQITELLTNYGKIDYLWFDGCGSEVHPYDYKRFVKVIRGLQPNVLIFNMWDPDIRWVGNEAGFAQMDNRNVIRLDDESIYTQSRPYLHDDTFLPAECDCMIRDEWFWSEAGIVGVKSAEELMGMYQYSVGRGANMLINISPDRRGQLPEKDVEQFMKFAQMVKDAFGTPVELQGEPVRNDQTYHVDLKKGEMVQYAILEEVLDQEHTEQIRAFTIKVNGLLVYRGLTVGHKCICKFPPIKAWYVDVEIEKEDGPSQLKSIQLY